jgi:hypothetical protein
MDPRRFVNIDETSIINDLYVSSFTLKKPGARRTIGMKKTSGTSGRCTVLLGVTFSGEKIPLFILFKKGTSDGQISRH